MTIQAFRGEHGDQVLQTGLGSYSFSERQETARLYAESPNNKITYPVAKNPKIITAEIAIANPVINTPDDPFLDFSQLATILTIPELVKLAIQFSDYIHHTNNWEENFSDFLCVEDLLKKHPERVTELYMLAYPLLDNKAFVQALISAGYDGAIHGGCGENSCEIEYKVFSESQIKVITVNLLCANQPVSCAA